MSYLLHFKNPRRSIGLVIMRLKAWVERSRRKRFLYRGIINKVSAKHGSIRILLCYNRVSHHMAEFVNIALRKRYPNIEVFGCGPNNEFHISDGPRSHKKIAELANRLKVDVFWEIESGHVSKEFQFIRAFPPISAVKLWWVNDSHQFLDLMVAKAPYFDRVFVSMKDDVQAFGKNAFWLPGSASLDVALDFNVPRVHDISFVGSMDSVHSKRVEIINMLKVDFPQINIKNNLFLDDMAFEYSSTKIVFNLSLNRDLNYRVFEALACGALLLTDRIGNGLLDLFEDGKDIIVYDTYEDLCQKIKYYLQHEDERKAIAKSGQLKVKKYHTVDNRIDSVINQLSDIFNEKSGLAPNHSSFISGNSSKALP